jgi:hypothetical protein
MIESKMVDVLLAASGVTAIIGTRIFPVVVKQTTAFPSLVYRRLPGGERTYSLAGSAGWTTVIVAIYAWASDYPTARSLANEVRKALDAYASNTADNIQVASVSDGGDEWIDELAVYGCGVDVTLHYLEV